MDQLMQNLRAHMDKLALEIGSRHCGSEGEALSADYIEAYFKSLGLEVFSESYPTRGWRYESFELTNVTKGRPVPGAIACCYSAAVDLEGELLVIKPSQFDKLETLPVQGRICFISGLAGMVFSNNAIAEKLEELGAAAAIFLCTIHTDYHASTKIVRSPFINKIGTAAVNAEGAYDIARNIHDTYRLVIRAEAFDTESRNIVARMGKGEKKGVIGAHYDTAPNIQGACDNASGTAVLMELARLMKDQPLDMTLDFVTFSAEEYVPKDYPPGSFDYLCRHRHEDIRWFFDIDDCGQFLAEPYVFLEHPEKLPRLKSRYPQEVPDICHGDDKTFFFADIPCVWVYSKSPFCIIHTAYDNMDKVDYDLMIEEAGEMKNLLEQLVRAEKYDV